MAEDLRERLDKFRDELSFIHHFLLNEQYPPNLSSNQKRCLRRQKEIHMVKENKLYRKRKGKWVQIVTTPAEVYEILQFHHVGNGNHVGIVNTKCRIASKYYWFNMSKDVEEYISTCSKCLTIRPVKEHPVCQFKVLQPMQVVGMGLFGPLRMTKSGSQYILTIVDYFTKHVMLFPLQRKDGTGVNKCIQQYMSIFGAPKSLIYDQGKEVCNKINDEFFNDMGIKNCVSSTYHPQCSGLVKRVIGMMKMRVSKLMVGRGPNWDESLHHIIFSINSQQHPTTKYTPFFLMFGREPRTILEIKGVNRDTNIVEDDDYIEDYVEERDEILDEAYSKALKNQDEAYVKKAEKAREKRKAEDILSVGQLVLKREPASIADEDEQCDPRWTGPYRILEITEEKNVKLAARRIGHDDVPVAQMVNYDELRPLKHGGFHKLTRELDSESSTDTDPELDLNEEAYQREQTIKPMDSATAHSPVPGQDSTSQAGLPPLQ